jgi:uncharacterized protein YqgC (DUF456 family)
MDLPQWPFIVALIAMFVGVIGVLLPIVPGVGFIWFVVLVYAIAERFSAIDPLTFIFLTILGATGVTADLWMSQVGAKAGGASIWSLLVGLLTGVIGAIVGSVFLGVGAIPGAIIGAVAGVILAEYYKRKDWREALKAGGGWLVGCTLSGGIQLLIAILMIVTFIWQVLRG